MIDGFDYLSFIAGVQVGRRLKVWDASRHARPVPKGRYILTERNRSPLILEGTSGMSTLHPIITEGDDE